MTLEWNSLSDEAKAPFRAQTEVQKKRYEEEMKNYKAKKLAEAAENSVKPSTVTTAVASATVK